MILNAGCQLDWTWNHLHNTTIGTSVNHLPDIPLGTSVS